MILARGRQGGLLSQEGTWLWLFCQEEVVVSAINRGSSRREKGFLKWVGGCRAGKRSLWLSYQDNVILMQLEEKEVMMVLVTGVCHSWVGRELWQKDVAKRRLHPLCIITMYK